MMAGGYLAQNVDLPIPVVAAILCAPGYVLAGWSVARRHSAEAAAWAGAAAAVTGFTMVALEYIVGTAIIVGADMSGRYVVLGLKALPVVVLWGALCGVIGLALARLPIRRTGRYDTARIGSPVRTGPTYRSSTIGR